MSEAKHTPRPWMVCVSRVDGITRYNILNHIRTTIAMGREYWEEGEVPTEDEHGYFQPDDLCQINERKIADARLISAAPELLEACKDALLELRAGPVRDKVLAAIAKAEGRE